MNTPDIIRANAIMLKALLEAWHHPAIEEWKINGWCLEELPDVLKPIRLEESEEADRQRALWLAAIDRAERRNGP